MFRPHIVLEAKATLIGACNPIHRQVKRWESPALVYLLYGDFSEKWSACPGGKASVKVPCEGFLEWFPIKGIRLHVRTSQMQLWIHAVMKQRSAVESFMASCSSFSSGGCCDRPSCGLFLDPVFWVKTAESLLYLPPLSLALSSFFLPFWFHVSVSFWSILNLPEPALNWLFHLQKKLSHL